MVHIRYYIIGIPVYTYICIHQVLCISIYIYIIRTYATVAKNRSTPRSAPGRLGRVVQMRRGRKVSLVAGTMWPGSTILYYTILYYTILYYTILYYTILYYTILYYTILYYTILYYTILYYTILYYTILYYILYYTLLYSTILYSTAMELGWRSCCLLGKVRLESFLFSWSGSTLLGLGIRFRVKLDLPDRKPLH